MAKRRPTATQKLRKLVQQQVRRMENRGYRIDTKLKEKIKTGKYQTLKSIRKNKYAKLYENSTAEIDSNIVTGRRYRQYERKVSAEKAVETRRINEDRRRVERQAKEAYEAEVQSEIDKWEEERRKQDEQDYQLSESIDQGRVMYENITNLIDKFPRAGSDILQQALAYEINKYGLDLVMAGMAQTPINVVEEAQKIVFYNGQKESIHRAITNLFDSITGTIRSIQDSMAIGEAMDRMTDMSEL